MANQLDLDEVLDPAGHATRVIGETLEQFDRLTQMRIMQAVCILLGEDDLAAILQVARAAEQAAQSAAPKQDA